jgi:bifunctional UDP-N-acetylglucosamine pyrophosphorylase / glucosamine-1-phosphate N-acetyltransferase
VDYLIMKKIYFKQPTEIRTATILEEVFGCSEIYFEKDAVVVFMGTAILSNGVHFRGMCEIGDKVSIDTGCVLDNVSIGDGTNIRSHSILNNCNFGKKNIIGPHCFVRDDTSVGDFCIVGSHVEVARSKLGLGVKISHQAFVGDATLGDQVIIGAGVVFCNFDGSGRKSSKVGANTLVGSGVLIVSPIGIGERVVIGAGSVVSKNIEDDERFVQSRYRQINE